MNATRWQAWAAVGVVVAGMIGGLVLGRGGDDAEPRRGTPRRYYQYDAPQQHLMDQLVAGVLGPPSFRTTVRIDPMWPHARSGWEAYAPVAHVEDLHVDLPRADEPPPPEPAKVTLHVSKTGIAVDDGGDETDELALAVLTIQARVDPEVQVTIDLDDGVPYQRVIDVMDKVRGAGVEHFALGATP